MESKLKVGRVLTSFLLVAALGSLAAAQERPHLDPDQEIACAERADGTQVRMQCDAEARRCLVAKTRILRDGHPSSLIAQHLRPCVAAEPGAYERLERAGYTMVPALLETRHGYRRDERGRVFQTSFDLRRRMHLGVYDMLRFDDPDGFDALGQSLVMDLGVVSDEYDASAGRRYRHRFLEGQLMLAPFEIEGTFYSYDRSRASEEPAFWITTFLGSPRRFDVPIQLGGGYSLARLHYRRTEVGDLMLLDLADGRINWELYQGPGLENYLWLSMGAGFGLRHMEATGPVIVYGYPELALKSALVVGANGLTQVGFDARMKWAWEPDTSRNWMMGTASGFAERILIAISDQPISIFIEPQVRYTRVELAGLDGVDYRVLAGARLSLFTPTRPAPVELGQ